MLLEFRIKNYKSFVEETSFIMEAAPKQKGLDYSLCKEKIKKKQIKGLCSSVIYGANAAGKTNIIGAMDVLRSIILRGHIRNEETLQTPNQAAATLELIPNNNPDLAKPVEFLIRFIENGLLISYNLVIDLGAFLEVDYQRKILREELIVNNEMIFSRTDMVVFGNFGIIETYLSDSASALKNSIEQIAKNGLNDEELFLSNGFKVLISQSFVKMFNNWFENQFMVVYHADAIQLVKRFSDSQKQTVYVESTIDDAAKLFGVNSNAVGYVFSEEESKSKLCSIFSNLSKGKNVLIPAEMFESYGTIRFINIFPLVIRAIFTGATLVVDEFDASIHPMALMSIINIFHNDEINIHHAQLIFNTHNPIFLNKNLFRRDEIKFVERDDETHFSSLYSLADFGTSKETGVRKNEDYMKKYFISRYGAIKDIDFTPVFEELMKDVN